jgi:hypothetical protein
MNLTHFEIIGAVTAAVVTSALPAYRAAQKAAAQLESKTLGDRQTLREMVADVLHAQNRFADQLREHDQRQLVNTATIGQIDERLQKLELDLSEHLGER